MNSETGSFTATGQSAEVSGDVVDAMLSGTFSGTVDLEVQDAQGNWIAESSHTTPVAAINKQCAMARKWRLNCTAYTSGTIVYELSAGKSRDLKR